MEREILEFALSLLRKGEVDVLLVLSSREEIIGRVREYLFRECKDPNVPNRVIAVTTDKKKMVFEGQTIEIPFPVTNLEEGIKHAITIGLEEEIISPGEKICAIGPSEPDGEINSLSIRRARRYYPFEVNIMRKVDARVLKAVVDLAIELSGEGIREPRGTMFVIGDEREVLRRCSQLSPNPVKDLEVNVLDNKTKTLIIELAKLDGAFIISKDGRIVCAGAYIASNRVDGVPLGLGTRHIAAASITRETEAIAVVVSNSGVVRIFSDGEMVLEVKPKGRLL